MDVKLRPMVKACWPATLAMRAWRRLPRPPWRLLLFALGVLLLAGCEGREVQSALHPAGPGAAKIAWLWWAMFFICTTVFVLVMLVMLLAISRPRRAEDSGPPLGNKFIVVSGIILPSIVLIVLLILNLETSFALRRMTTSSENPLTIEVIGHQFWWEVRYPEQQITTANEFYIPTGEPVRLKLKAADVIHSFWVPQLHGKMDMLPDHTNTFWIQANRPGSYRGQCAEYCGDQHARMAMFVVALPPDEFEQWVAERLRPHPEPETELVARGQQVFFEAACDNCHAIRGTPATADIGPDLTHMGSRLTVGAGQWPNNYGNLAGWIANPQALKPGNLMPASYLASEDLHAVVAYLKSLP